MDTVWPAEYVASMNKAKKLEAQTKRLEAQVAKLKKENDELHELAAHYREQMAMLEPRGTG